MYKKLSYLILILVAADLFANDPTRPSYLKPEKKSNVAEQVISLNGVIHSKGKKLAIINQKTYRVGEKVGSYFVSDITKKIVILKRGEKILTLKLNETTVKKQSERK